MFQEVRNPEQNVPEPSYLLGIAGVVYVLVSWLATNVHPSDLPPQTLLFSMLFVEHPFPQVIFTLIALFAVLNTALLNFVTAFAIWDVT